MVEKNRCFSTNPKQRHDKSDLAKREYCRRGYGYCTWEAQGILIMPNCT
jgi:hypothetical protein